VIRKHLSCQRLRHGSHLDLDDPRSWRLRAGE
jgi:hypothetical protein